MALKVGITGGIGSGKSTVCRIFGVLGVPVYSADERARCLMEENAGLRREITGLLGSQAYRENGSLDRQWVASRVFTDPRLLEKLNAIVHPAVALDGEEWQHNHRHSLYTIREAALLFESGSYMALDRIIEVFAPSELRIERVMRRDAITRQQVLDRMARQWPEWKKLIMADDVILNDGQHGLVPQVIRLHRKFSS